MENIRELLVHELHDMLHAEKQLVKALPKMVKAASSSQLGQAIESHLRETEQHVNRLEQVFERLGEPPKAKKCDGIAGIIKEGEKLLREDRGGSVADAGLICSAQKVEHYEIAAYGSLCSWAEMLNEQEALSLLKQNLAEEKAADEKLTRLAEESINPAAQSGYGTSGEQRRGMRSRSESVSGG
jgi:ferritin-like metal-binding protein YciE